MNTMPLEGLEILVVENQYLIAAELARVLTRFGAAVVGPVARLPLDGCVASRSIDLALLDVQLSQGTSLPLADEMARRGVPVAFITGYGPDGLPAPYRHLLRLDKPVVPDQLRAAVMQLTGRDQGVAA